MQMFLCQKTPVESEMQGLSSPSMSPVREAVPSFFFRPNYLDDQDQGQSQDWAGEGRSGDEEPQGHWSYPRSARSSKLSASLHPCTCALDICSLCTWALYTCTSLTCTHVFFLWNQGLSSPCPSV